MNWIKVKDQMPDNGKIVLLCLEGVKLPLRASYIPKFYMKDDGVSYDGDADYNEDNDTYYWPEGWYEWNEMEEVHYVCIEKVIAWMELPIHINELKPFSDLTVEDLLK